MHKPETIDYSEQRKEVAKILSYVLSGRLSVREAILDFPKTCDDGTIIACKHALCHLEADEDIRVRDALYEQEQDKYLEFIQETLERGDELPANIINSYIRYYPDGSLSEEDSAKGIWHKLKRFICC